MLGVSGYLAFNLHFLLDPTPYQPSVHGWDESRHRDCDEDGADHRHENEEKRPRDSRAYRPQFVRRVRRQLRSLRSELSRPRGALALLADDSQNVVDDLARHLSCDRCVAKQRAIVERRRQRIDYQFQV